MERQYARDRKSQSYKYISYPQTDIHILGNSNQNMNKIFKKILNELMPKFIWKGKGPGNARLFFKGQTRMAAEDISLIRSQDFLENHSN